MCRSTRAQKTPMTLKIKVELRRISYLAVYHCSSWTVSALVSVSSILREEPDVVTFSDDNDGDLRRNFQLGTGELQCVEF